MPRLIILPAKLLGDTVEESIQKATRFIQRNNHSSTLEVGDILRLGADLGNANKFGWDGFKVIRIYHKGDLVGVPYYVITDENTFQPDSWNGMFSNGTSVLYFSPEIQTRIANQLDMNFESTTMIKGRIWRFHLVTEDDWIPHPSNHLFPYYQKDLQDALRHADERITFFYWGRGHDIEINYRFDRAREAIALLEVFESGSVQDKKSVVDALRDFRWILSDAQREEVDEFYLHHLMGTNNLLPVDVLRMISRYGKKTIHSSRRNKKKRSSRKSKHKL